MKKLGYFTLITVWVLSLIAVWYWRSSFLSNASTAAVQIREDSSDYHYINPLLLAGSPDPAPEWGGLKDLFTDYIHQAQKTSLAKDVSVYFRDVNTGRWTGVNDQELYDPSSMMKVAVMMGYLRQAEHDPSILNTELDYVHRNDHGQHYPPTKPLATGQHSVKELIEAMIIDSDNDALNALYDYDRDAFVEVFKLLHIPPPPSVTTTDFMSPQIYSRLFRVLFNATYISPALSEYALNLLAHTSFQRGFIAGLPTNAVVAHKFGEHTAEVSGVPQSRQLHECGIIYYPEHPYFLCVMTRGQDFASLEKVIARLAAISYQAVKAKNP